MEPEIRDGRIYLPEELDVLERFDRDYKGWILKHGPEIGEKAMMGDEAAHQVILRYQSFVGWLTDWSLAALDVAIRDWEKATIH